MRDVYLPIKIRRMKHKISHISLMVREYDEGIAFYTEVIGFELLEDTDMGNGKRWVRLGPEGAGPDAVGLVLMKASKPEQQDRVGDQTGNKVFLFLDTDDFDRDYARLQSHGVTFCEPQPRHEAWGTVIVFEDLYGNKIDLIERVNQ